MWQDLVNYIESDVEMKHKLSFLNTLINVQGINLENEDDINLVKASIRVFCADATQRAGGLLLLFAVVHCSPTVYVDNWSQIVLGSLQIPDSLISREVPLKVVNRMLINFGSNSDYSDVFSKVIPEILPTLLNPEDEKIYKISCQTLAVCMKCVPELAGTRVADIEKLLLKELDNPYGEIVEAIGECFSALPMCILHLQRKGSIEYKEIWCNIFMKILNTMHLVFNRLMQMTEDQEEFVDVSSLPVFEIPYLQSDNNRPLSLIDIFKSLCQCMAKMMSSGDHIVRLPVTDLLKTLFRVFQIEKFIKDQNQDQRIVYLKLGFPQMLNGVYIVLEALILNFSIIEQSRNFLVIIKMSLKAMEETSFSQSCVGQVRGSTWKLFNVWLTQYESKASYGLARDKYILHEVLADVNIEINESIQSTQLEDSNVEEKNKVNKISACTHALKALKNLLETSTCYMESNSVENICSTLLKIAHVVAERINSRRSFPFPYSEEKCRKMLFDVLLSCAVCAHPLHCKGIMEAQNIFSTASMDTSLKVRRICHRFRKLSRYYLNPRKPPPDAEQYSHPSMLVSAQQPVIESVRAEWGNGIEWNNTNGPSSDDQMDDSEVAPAQEENEYMDKMESESDLMTIGQTEDNENRVNHEYRRVSKQSSQSAGEEESIDDSDIEPTYVSTDSNPQRINQNESSLNNSFGMQSSVEQYVNERRTERCASEEVPNSTNSVENNIEEHVSALVEGKCTQKTSQVPVGNGEWRTKESNESDEDESDMDEEGDEEGEVNEDISDNAADEASDGKRSPEYDEERPIKRQKCVDEEPDEDVDEEGEDDDIPVNNQSSDEENELNNSPVQNVGNNSENLADEESQAGDDPGCSSPTIQEMCRDFVLEEPKAQEIS